MLDSQHDFDLAWSWDLGRQARPYHARQTLDELSLNCSEGGGGDRQFALGIMKMLPTKLKTSPKYLADKKKSKAHLVLHASVVGPVNCVTYRRLRPSALARGFIHQTGSGKPSHVGLFVASSSCQDPISVVVLVPWALYMYTLRCSRYSSTRALVWESILS